MATTNPAGGYLGTSYNVPTDPQYYLSQTGLSSLAPQAFNADTLAAMFSPQGMQYTPANNMATNPFLELFMKSSGDAMKLQRKQIPGQPPSSPQDQNGGGAGPLPGAY